jgi:hypothetical protein
MNQLTKNSLIIFCGMLCSCHSVQRTVPGKSEMPAMITDQAVPATRIPTSAGGPGWAPRLYAVFACGSFNAITNTPASNHVRVYFKKWGGDDPEGENVGIFGLTNEESREILWWNVRVQVPAKGKGTDGLGWDTVYDNYPTPTPATKTSHFPPGSSGEFSAPRPEGSPWRVCILYSIKVEEPDGMDGVGKRYGGNYEVRSPEMK